MTKLKFEFFNRSPLIVAKELLGKVLSRRLGNLEISGRIVETEAYLAIGDESSHGFSGQTKRNASLFKRAGHIYIHSMHRQNCLDIVTEEEGVPSSVLIRALEPLTEVEMMKKNRNKIKITDLASGPGKLTQALQITKDFDGSDLLGPNALLSILDDTFKVEQITATTRIGISKSKEEKLRFYITGSQFVSRK